MGTIACIFNLFVQNHLSGFHIIPSHSDVTCETLGDLYPALFGLLPYPSPSAWFPLGMPALAL